MADTFMILATLLWLLIRQGLQQTLARLLWAETFVNGLCEALLMGIELMLLGRSRRCASSAACCARTASTAWTAPTWRSSRRGCPRLGRQLVGLGLAARADLDPRSSAASHLMSMYESMGNTLARQVCFQHPVIALSLHYNGSATRMCPHSIEVGRNAIRCSRRDCMQLENSRAHALLAFKQ